MSYRILAKRVKQFLENVFKGDEWTKSTKLLVTPQISDVRVRETREGYDITINMQVKL